MKKVLMSFEGMEYLGCIGLLELRIRASGGEDSIGYGTVIGGSRRWIYLIWVCLVPFRDEACGVIMGDMGSRLIALEIFSSYRIRGCFFSSMAWCLELAAFCLRTAAWVDVYPSSLLPISCVSTTS